MTDEHDLARPRATPIRRTRRPSFAAPKDTGTAHPLNELAPDLEAPWLKQDTETPDRTTLYTHPEGHRIGLRVQPGDLTIQTWIAAGPDLPPIPDGTDEEQAEAQAANDARLQPGRTWHATVTTRHPDYVRGLLGAVVRHQLIPALSNKPKRVASPIPAPDTKPEPEPTKPAAKKRRTTAKKGTQK
ncbi:hypothetical protein J7E88_13015 [Streptomyces sp. ISL-10]|uniref:hypothetical protein n=1 Tax=Streptomyces sp. ISL-10 TaxID=2819172 RepID=UPI001BE60424|nr:hypothetical protein [Streptomyces sp. ISL-10]MBT2366205.1 hypothetical protein [Streptomyces sp. ISL-10]